MTLDETTTFDWLLAHNTRPVTAEQLWRASYPDCPLEQADTGFKPLYQNLAKAINAITAMYSPEGLIE